MPGVAGKGSQKAPSSSCGAGPGAALSPGNGGGGPPAAWQGLPLRSENASNLLPSSFREGDRVRSASPNPCGALSTLGSHGLLVGAVPPFRRLLLPGRRQRLRWTLGHWIIKMAKEEKAVGETSSSWKTGNRTRAAQRHEGRSPAVTVSERAGAGAEFHLECSESSPARRIALIWKEYYRNQEGTTEGNQKDTRTRAP